MATSGMFKVLKDVLLLTDKVQQLNVNTSRLADKVENMDKRLVRVDTMIEIAKFNPVKIELQDP